MLASLHFEIGSVCGVQKNKYEKYLKLHKTKQKLLPIDELNGLDWNAHLAIIYVRTLIHEKCTHTHTFTVKSHLKIVALYLFLLIRNTFLSIIVSYFFLFVNCIFFMLRVNMCVCTFREHLQYLEYAVIKAFRLILQNL